MLILGYFLAALVGLSLGLLGGGGAILTVPIFVYVLGYDPKLAIAMSLPVVGVTSLVGALGHWRAGNIDLRIAALFGVVAMTGAYVGARLASYLTATTQLVILGVVMVAAAISMLRSARRPQGAVSMLTEPGDPAYGLLLSVAACVGMITGLVGVGGGFLAVPALVLLARVPMQHAVGTSLFVIAMNCAAGFAGHAGDIDAPWQFMMGFTAVAVGGIILGTFLVRFVAQRALKQAFAVFLLLMGTFILAKNRELFM